MYKCRYDRIVTSHSREGHCSRCWSKYQKGRRQRQLETLGSDHVKMQTKKHSTSYYAKHRDTIRLKNRDKALELVEAKRQKLEHRRQLRKAHYERNKEHILSWRKSWCQKNRDKVATMQRKRYRTNVNHRLGMILRSRLGATIKGRHVSSKELLGCSADELRLHLEKQFREGMTWDNYGKPKANECTWVIDHIRPCASFDLTQIEQQRLCFHYTNLQPLWWDENQIKSDWVDPTVC